MEKNKIQINNEQTAKDNDRKPFLVFHTQEELDSHNKKLIDEYSSQIESLRNEKAEFESSSVEWRNRFKLFTDHLFKKYDVLGIDIPIDNLDISSFENLEKSLLINLEKQKIQYKKTNYNSNELKKEMEKTPKIYLV